MPAELATLRSTLESTLLENADLKSEREALKRRIAWFEKQFFGRKSEKRLIDNPYQNSLLGEPAAPAEPEGETITVTYERGKAKKARDEDCVNDSGLRFGPDVPVEVITLEAPELQGPDAGDYEVIGTKSTFRLAKTQASYVVLRYDRTVVKRKGSDTPAPCPAPFNVLERSVADVSFLVGLLVDKFLYHLPLYRQHQQLTDAGITVSRATLTNLVKRSIDLLRPIVAAQLDSVLASHVLAMDETPIKAGRAGQGKMKQGWFWPVYGDQGEVVFTWSTSRGRQHIENTLRERFKGVLLTDGYAAYARYAKGNEQATHAQCWVHGRRHFVEAETSEPALVAEALEWIGLLYRIEDEIRERKLVGDKKHQYRLAHSKRVVDDFFDWCEKQLRQPGRLPKDPFTQALGYMLKRQAELRVFLEDPDVPLDTNHVERTLRVIPMGRKAWLFCWTEIGAEHVGLIQSLIATCRLHGIDPYTYLTDVLLRINIHPASEVADLTPRLWKEKFAANPLRSDLWMARNTSAE
jgi:transposase